MTELEAYPSGFVAKCRCGVYVSAVDVLRTPSDDARTMLGRWLWDGLTVEPRFGSWGEKIGACQCDKGGEDADEAMSVVRAAVHWWESRRPLSFTLDEHLEHCTVNTRDDSEKKLARAVANAVRINAVRILEGQSND